MKALPPVLTVRRWQRIVEHETLDSNAMRVTMDTLSENQTPAVVPTSRCVTPLPAIVCSCGLCLIEVGVDDGLGPRAVGWEGR